MLPGVDLNRVYLWTGLTHPVFGPPLFAYYTAIVGPVVAYGWYVEWVRLMLESADDRQKPAKPFTGC